MEKNGLTANVLMIRPANFGFNEETAASNAFQEKGDYYYAAQVKEMAIKEFDGFVATLENAGVNVTVIQDSDEPVKPDAVFPNNWFSSHKEQGFFLYPMLSAKRRLEVRPEIIAKLQQKFNIEKATDWSFKAKDNLILEGTGSLVLDRVNNIAYACYSPRTNKYLLEKWGNNMNYEVIGFHATDEDGQEIYHTNVLMAMGDHFVVICLDAITDLEEREQLIEKFEITKKEIIDITFEQMNAFAGNMLQLRNNKDERCIVLSRTALNSLKNAQILTLNKHGKFIIGEIATIEKYGGGSVRCMLAELFV